MSIKKGLAALAVNIAHHLLHGGINRLSGPKCSGYRHFMTACLALLSSAGVLVFHGCRHQESAPLPGERGSLESSYFDFEDAVALVRESIPNSRLKKLDSNGNLTDVVSGGGPVIRDFEIRADGSVFLVLAEANCQIAAVERRGGKGACVEAKIGPIVAPGKQVYSTVNLDERDRNGTIQFDSTGAAYYYGIDSSTGKYVLRKYSEQGGTHSNLLQSDSHSVDFVVLADGTVFFTSGWGYTQYQHVIIKVAPDGRSSVLLDDSTPILYLFPDGNVYFTRRGSTSMLRLERILSGTESSIDPRWWVASLSPSDAYYDTSEIVVNPAFADKVADTDGGRRIVSAFAHGLYSDGYHTTRLFQYFPTFSETRTSVYDITALGAVGHKVAASGVTSAGVPRTIIYDPDTDVEMEICESLGVTLDHLEYSGRSGKLIFQSFSDKSGNSITGDLDLSTGNVRIYDDAGSSKAWAKLRAL